MNKQELIERIEGLKNIFGNKCEYVKIDFVIELASELDELEAGHADEAPRYVKNILARLRELPLHDREVWLKAIMGEFEQDFSNAKWREGYEQGKVEGLIKREKVTIPQFVADYIDFKKTYDFHVYGAMREIEDHYDKRVQEWFYEGNIGTFVRAWLDGYEVENEKRYLVKMKGFEEEYNFLNYFINTKLWIIQSDANNSNYRTHHTRKELEQAGFGWVFNCPGIDIEEVEE